MRPRRPKGGPDGSRDIEAIHLDQTIVWGAVGFRANATDSASDKKWVKKKFKADLEAAQAENPSLAGFIFFTNVDLTPAEVAALERHAREKGLSFVDIYWRERLRISLDSPPGLSLRFQHLGLHLSDAEQVAFFAEYGSKIEALIGKGFGAVEERLKRLEFMQDCSKPLLGGSIRVYLKREYTPEDLGHFRFLAEILDFYERDPHPGLWIAGRDAYPTVVTGSDSHRLVAVKSLVWSRRPDENIQDMIVGALPSVNFLEAGGHLHKRGPYRTLGSLDRRSLSIFVTKPLLNHIDGICLCANDYALACAGAEDFVPLDNPPLEPWPEDLTSEESAVPWVTLLLKMENPPAWVRPELARTRWNLDFSTYTPEKQETG